MNANETFRDIHGTELRTGNQVRSTVGIPGCPIDRVFTIDRLFPTGYGAPAVRMTSGLVCDPDHLELVKESE